MVTGMNGLHRQLQRSKDQPKIQHVEGVAVMNHSDLLYGSLEPKSDVEYRLTHPKTAYSCKKVRVQVKQS